MYGGGRRGSTVLNSDANGQPTDNRFRLSTCAARVSCCWSPRTPSAGGQPPRRCGTEPDKMPWCVKSAPTPNWPTLRGTGPSRWPCPPGGAILVRPDQHVAARSDKDMDPQKRDAILRGHDFVPPEPTPAKQGQACLRGGDLDAHAFPATGAGSGQRSARRV
jgi:hypothetical protein